MKQGPGESATGRAPEVVALPPTDRATFVAPPEVEQIRRRFNAGEYRACVEPIERLFFARRNTFHQGLLQYVVALLQLRLGLIRSPRRLLRQALDLLAPYPDWQEGFDVAPIRRHATGLLETLPGDVDQTTPDAAATWWMPPPVL